MMADDRQWHVVPPLTPGVRPVDNLARELAVQSVSVGRAWTVADTRRRLEEPDGLSRVADELLAAGSAAGHRSRLLLVVDQFEEILTLSEPTQAQQFANLLRHALDGSVSVVATLRPEFLDSILAAPFLKPLQFRVTTVRPLDKEGLASIIREPAKMAGIHIDDILVERLVSDTGAGDALPLLAFTLQELTLGIRRGGRISAQHYDAIGGVMGAVSKQAQTALVAACAQTGRSEYEVLTGLLSLVSVDNVGRPSRRRVSLMSLPASVREELHPFVAARLITTDHDPSGAVNVHVAHEAILTAWRPLADAVGRTAQALRTRGEVESATHEWAQQGHPQRLLWERGPLAAALEGLGARLRRPRRRVWRAFKKDLVVDTIEVDTTALRFLTLSLKIDKRRRRRSVTILATMLAVALMATGIALYGQYDANRQRKNAEEQAAVAAKRLDDLAASRAQFAELNAQNEIVKDCVKSLFAFVDIANQTKYDQSDYDIRLQDFQTKCESARSYLTP
jgi:hypothetical protein